MRFLDENSHDNSDKFSRPALKSIIAQQKNPLNFYSKLKLQKISGRNSHNVAIKFNGSQIKIFTLTKCFPSLAFEKQSGLRLSDPRIFPIIFMEFVIGK